MDSTSKFNVDLISRPGFLTGGGEMGRLIRDYDWSQTSAGAIEQWPKSLQVTLGILLHSAFPMFLFWGKDFLCFYNDAYRPSLGENGKHPAIGKKGKEVWPEIWDFIGPLIDKVMNTGEPVWFEDQLVPIYRNGKIEDVWWTFSYSAVYNDDGQINGVFVTCTETTQKVLNLEKLAESESELKFAIEATELGTWDYHPLTNKITVNGRVKEWFGIPADHPIDLSHAACAIAGYDRQRVREAIQKAMQYESGGYCELEFRVINPVTGKEIIVRAKGRARFNDDKVAYRFNGTLQDVTTQAVHMHDQKTIAEKLENVVAERTKELKQKNIELQKSIDLLHNQELKDVQKNNFIAMASHELKTPITSIKGYVQLLLTAMDNQKKEIKSLPPLLVRSSLISVDKQITRLTRLISELLDLSNIETGTLKLRKDKFSLNELAIETVEDILYTNTTHKINLLHDIKCYVHADKDRIGQVMINFLTNAIKYSPNSDKIDVRIHRTANGEAAFSVKDYGIGIEKDEQKKIFERFYRAKGREEQTYPGFGIGLFIAHEFVMKHGGQMMVESDKGKGSVFTFTLPISSN